MCGRLFWLQTLRRLRASSLFARVNGWLISPAWRAGACRLRACRLFTATMVRPRGAPCRSLHGFSRSGGMASVAAWLPPSPSCESVGTGAAAVCAWAAARLARRRAGEPMKYSIKPTGSSPYKTKVTPAPSSVPIGLVASATAIMNAMYSQTKGTMYIGKFVREYGATRRPRKETPCLP